MEQSVQDNVTLPADELEKLFSASAPANEKPPAVAGAGFNYNKLYAVLCMGASALVSVATIIWLVTT